MKIFRANGTKFVFDTDGFVYYYKDDYYLNNSEYIEREIKKILHKGKTNKPFSKTDIARILAWKIGFIDHKESTSGFVYKEYWSDIENRAEQIDGVVKGSTRSKTESFPIGKIADFIVNEQDNLRKLAQKNNPFDFLTEFKINGDFKGLGTVYILTLLYFLSGEKFPIYDKFAHKAAKAIVLDVNPKDVYVGPAPYKTEINNILTMYSEYCWLLTQVFTRPRPEITRKEDQALWVYGHRKEKFPVSDDKSIEKKLFDFDNIIE